MLANDALEALCRTFVDHNADFILMDRLSPPWQWAAVIAGQTAGILTQEKVELDEQETLIRFRPCAGVVDALRQWRETGVFSLAPPAPAAELDREALVTCAAIIDWLAAMNEHRPKHGPGLQVELSGLWATQFWEMCERAAAIRARETEEAR